MKIKSFFYICIFIAAYGFTAYSQNEVDALRYSQTTFGGTARSQAIAGAFGALGGDFSSLSSNPAGVAVYRKPEVSFSPTLFKQETSSSFFGYTRNDNKYNFNFSNAGIVYAYPINQDKENAWKGWSFGFGYNRLNNFNKRTLYEGMNPDNSMLDYYAEQASGTYPSKLSDSNPFDANLAFQSYLINPYSNDSTQYYNTIPYAGEWQRRSSTTKGGMGELLFSFGGNYNNRLYVGASLAFPNIRYKEETTYEEIDKKDTIYDFKSYTLNQDITTTGTGFNFKLGLIYRANDWVRLGASIHTPTFFSMNDEYTNRIRSLFDNGDSFTESSPNGSYDYSLSSPLKAIGSIAFIFQKKGLLSIDYEFIDYSDARLRSSTYKYFDENDAIQQNYHATGNIHIGTEWKINPYSFRAGYAVYGSPFRSGIVNADVNMQKTIYTAGFGIRNEGYFIDFAYVFTKYGDFYRPYYLNTEKVEGTSNQNYTYSFVVTMGAKF